MARRLIVAIVPLVAACALMPRINPGLAVLATMIVALVCICKAA